MSIIVKAHTRAGRSVKSHTRGTRSRLAQTADRWKEKKLKTLKSNAYSRYKTAMYMKGVSRKRRDHLFRRFRRLELAFNRSIGL